MNARFYIDQLDAAIAKSGIAAKVMFSQDDGKLHLWGDGWEFLFTPGKLPVEIERFGTPPSSDAFREHVGSLLQAWSRHAGVFTPLEQERLQAYKDTLDES
jgi:hypothetical protein